MKARQGAAIAALWLSWCPAAQSQEAGRLTICNGGSSTLMYASWRETGGNAWIPVCQLQRVNCQIESAGWFELRKGACHIIDIGSRWEVYLSILQRDGTTWSPVTYDVKTQWASGIEAGMSGTTHLSLCGSSGKFDQVYPLTLDQAFNEPCADRGLEPISLSAVVRTAFDQDFTLWLK